MAGSLEARVQPIQSGVRLEISTGGVALTFRQLFDSLESDATFADWYSELLSGTSYDAFYWEHPPLTEHNVDDAAEFVLIESPMLARLRPDPEPFSNHFDQNPDASIITFPNLGGDALLVVPAAIASNDAYPHLAAFVRSAPVEQVRALWQEAAQVVRQNLGPEPRWLSTAGGGVSWLHLRLDTWPKYYSFVPYKSE